MEESANNVFNIKSLDGDAGFKEKCENFLREWGDSSPELQVKTSGSTGVPKVILVQKKYMAASAHKTCDFLGLKPGDSALICLPAEYISGKMMLVRGMVCRLEMMLVAPSLNPLSAVNRDIVFAAMTPLQAENSLDKLHHLHKIILGGAMVSASLQQKIFKALGASAKTKIYETYGMSETLSHIALRQIFPKSEMYFQAMAGVAVSADERGCLVIDSADIGVENLVTNDLVELKTGNKFRMVGRWDNVINSGGGKVVPEMIEERIAPFLTIDFAIAGRRDAALGEKIVLVVAGNFDQKKEVEIAEVLAGIAFEKSWHRPKGIVFVKEIPRTETDKIARATLKKLINED